MKYVLGVALLALAMTGCTSNQKNEVLQEKAMNTTSTDTHVINFSGPNGLLILLKSSDNFETAEMTDNSGKAYRLKRTISGSGIRLANDDGIVIHFKAGEGMVEFVKDQPINIVEYKK